MPVEPFLKWPGGKRWLVVRHKHLFPQSFTRYIEPFLGGGAVFFHILPPRAILSDTNVELINTYQTLKEHAKSIDEKLSKLHAEHGPRLYYHMRDLKPVDPLERAVRFLYLNRTCFNGLYRVNRRGDFNVPIGSKKLVRYPSGYLQSIASVLSNARILVADFEATIEAAKRGDFVYVDPPYTVMHNNNNFIKYNANLFSWADQERLATVVLRASKRGVRIMISNADHISVRGLYGEFGPLRRVARCSVLSANSLHRCETSELLIINYKTGVS